MKDLVIFGAGGFGREIRQLVEDLNADGAGWHPLGYLDGDASLHGRAIGDDEVLGGPEWLARREGVAVVIAVGAPSSKLRIERALAGTGATRFATLVHPRATVGRRVELGPGTLICAGTTITVDVRVGRHAILNLGCTVGHDAMVGDLVTLAPSVNVSGGCTIEEGAEIGTGARLLPRVRVGRWSVVGAGAVVTADLPPDVTAVGMPAKAVKRRDAGWHER